ncbi:MAG: GNAT family N-acetyltransferase [Phycisphaerae bacterium]
MSEWQILDATDGCLEAVSHLRGATFFHSPRWTRVLVRGFDCTPRVVALVGPGGGFRAAWPACLLKMGPIRMLYGVFPKGNFVGDAGAIAEHIDGLGACVRREGLHAIRMIACEDTPIRGLPVGSRARHVRHVLEIDGRSAEQIWEDYPKKIRRDVRVPMKAGYVARPMRREEFPVFHRMMGEVFVRNAAATGLPPAFYEAVWDEMTDDGTAEFIVADKDGVPHAAVVAIHAGSTTYYFAGCSWTESMSDGVNDLTVHALIASAARRGAAEVDMLSSDARHAGLIRFKSKWGAERRPFDVLEWWFAPARHLLWKTGLAVADTRAGAALIRRLRGRK